MNECIEFGRSIERALRIQNIVTKLLHKFIKQQVCLSLRNLLCEFNIRLVQFNLKGIEPTNQTQPDPDVLVWLNSNLRVHIHHAEKFLISVIQNEKKIVYFFCQIIYDLESSNIKLDVLGSSFNPRRDFVSTMYELGVNPFDRAHDWLSIILYMAKCTDCCLNGRCSLIASLLVTSGWFIMGRLPLNNCLIKQGDVY